MAQAAQPLRMSFLEYVAFEKTADVKHEYLDGHVRAMDGGMLEHAQLAANMIRELGTRLDGGPCKTFTADARVRVRATGLSTYPDVTVICGPIERDPDDASTATNPTVIVDDPLRLDRGLRPR